ncbi:hypothetical protein K438DRAFT_1931893 [Mycena galopus ATCC 62051]|nr:hypothetical protein K438DRAFT_1931893 [Mycena galopus ATCC 62051]
MYLARATGIDTKPWFLNQFSQFFSKREASLTMAMASMILLRENLQAQNTLRFTTKKGKFVIAIESPTTRLQQNNTSHKPYGAHTKKAIIWLIWLVRKQVINVEVYLYEGRRVEEGKGLAEEVEPEYALLMNDWNWPKFWPYQCYSRISMNKAFPTQEDTLAVLQGRATATVPRQDCGGDEGQTVGPHACTYSRTRPELPELVTAGGALLMGAKVATRTGCVWHTWFWNASGPLVRRYSRGSTIRKIHGKRKPHLEKISVKLVGLQTSQTGASEGLVSCPEAAEAQNTPKNARCVWSRESSWINVREIAQGGRSRAEH